MIDMRTRKNLDIPLLLLTYLLAACGLVILFSAAQGTPIAYHQKQIFRIAVGTVCLIGMALVDYHHYFRFSRHIYILNLVLLLLVLKVGNEVKGASRWINIAGFPFQPSEFAKLFIIITLAI